MKLSPKTSKLHAFEESAGVMSDDRYRELHEGFVVVELSGDVEPDFKSFATHEAALAYLYDREDGYKAWIIGPEWTEFHD
jgi:hypothetical protein